MPLGAMARGTAASALVTRGVPLTPEADGHYWHVVKSGAIEHDAARDAHLQSLGYAVLRVPEQDIKAGQFGAILKAVA